MNAPPSAAPAEKPVTVTVAVPSDKHSGGKGRTLSHPKIFAQFEPEAERMRTTLARMTSNSVDELDGLVSQLQEVSVFLKSESERIQREIINYSQLNQSALAAIKVITETIGPWKSTTIDSDLQHSGGDPVADQGVISFGS